MRKLSLLALSLIGFFDAIYLLWEYTSPASPMVCMGGGCDAVRASSYAHFGGLPVPLYGVVMYVFLGLLIFLFPLLPSSATLLSQTAVMVISGLGFAVSAYLTGIEAFVLHSYCIWCLASAAIVTSIFVLALMDRFTPSVPLDAAKALGAVQKNFALVLFAVAIGVPSFILLTRNGSIPAAKTPSKKTVQAHLVRPDTHFYGNPHARVTIVEFGDFECPACGHAEIAAQKVRKNFGKEIRFAFRQFPLSGIHPYAEKAAEASECAAQQGKFWQAVDMFYKHQDHLGIPDLSKYAGEMGLNSRKFVTCIQKGEMQSRVAQDISDGEALGVHATPTFFVNGHMIVGPISYQQFAELIKNDLKMSGTAAMASASDNPVTSKPAEQAPAMKTKTSPTKAAGKKSTKAQSTQTQSSVGNSADTMQVLGGSSNLLASLQQNAAGACSEAEAKEKQPKMIETSQAKALYGKRPQTVFVDVRSATDFDSGHIPGAVNMPIDSFEKDWHRLPKNKTIVLYQGGHSTGDICAASRSAGRILLTQGFGYNEVKVYREGLAGWRKAGLPVKR